MFNTETLIFSSEMKPRPGDFSERAALNEAVGESLTNDMMADDRRLPGGGLGPFTCAALEPRRTCKQTNEEHDSCPAGGGEAAIPHVTLFRFADTCLNHDT